MNNVTILILFIILQVLHGLAPLFIIWSLNHLFGLDIQYTFLNWLATFTLVIGVRLLLTTKVEIKRS